MGKEVTAEDVHQVVRQFWDGFRSKSEERLRELYARSSTAFETGGARAEPGKLGVARRAREYFHREAQFEVQVGAVEVTLLSETTAVATYTFKFHAKQRRTGPGKMEDESLDVVRATQVWGLEDGKLRIVHEHFSVPTK